MKKRIINALLYSLMTPVGFLGGWYASNEKWLLVGSMILVGMILEFVAVFTYTDVIASSINKDMQEVIKHTNNKGE